MMITLLKAKIHRATITQAELHYIGSITIDEQLLITSGILEYVKVTVVNIDNGNRFETYVIKGDKNTGVICVNGAAARLVQKGDKVIIMAYCDLNLTEAATHKPKVLFMNENNNINEIANHEKHGQII